MRDEFVERVKLVQKFVGIFLASGGKDYDLEFLAHLFEEGDGMWADGEIVRCGLAIFVAERYIYIFA